jgi:hypothetical protein
MPHNSRVHIKAAAPCYARPFVAMFLAAVVVCALAAVNAWPFSNWELFSRLRADQESSWVAVAVDAAGRDRDYPIAALPRSASARDAVCDRWLRVARTDRLDVYRLTWLLTGRRGNRPAPRRRTLVWVCSERGA